MSAAVDQAAVQAVLSGLNRYQIEDLCSLVAGYCRREIRNLTEEHEAQVALEGFDWVTDWHRVIPRLKDVKTAADKLNLHVVVLTLGDMAGSLHDSEVVTATAILKELADAVHTIESRKDR